MTDIQIAIPSYKRSKEINKRTLAYIGRTNFPLSNVTVFVANEEERILYAKALHKSIRIVVGEVGMAEIRNVIHNHYPEGTKILQMDDDVAGVFEKTGDQTKDEVDDLIYLAEMGFEACLASGSRLWGIYPVANAYFMSYTTSFDLKFIYGSFFGHYADPDDDLRTRLSGKEDWERSMRYFQKYGTVARLNWFTQKSDYLKLEGGINASDGRNEETEEKEIRQLLEWFPHLCSRNSRKKTPEVKLKRIK